MSNFEIKRGMCFYLDEPSKTEPVPCTTSCSPQKKRPYMVLSNDKCNASSNLVHVAPILTRTYDPKRWYCVPFKSMNNRDVVVDVSAIMLVDKTLLDEAAYTQGISFYTMNNEVLMKNIKTAIQRQFALDDFTTRYDSCKVTEPVAPTVSNTQNTVPEIHLTINLNGVPINATVPMDNSIKVPVEVSVEPTIKEEEQKPQKKIARAVSGEINRMVSNDKVMKLSGAVGKRFTDKEQEYIRAYIKENYTGFGGKMTFDKISSNLGISLGTVSRYTNAIKGESTSTKSTVAKSGKRGKRGKRSSIPKRLCEQFYNDYKDHGVRYVLERYRKFGFKHDYQVYDAIRRNKNIQKFKKKEPVEITT